MLGSANITGSPLMHIMCGNLSHQIEHHLFPDLPSNRYGEVARPVRALFEDHGLRYHAAPLVQQVASAWHKVLPALAAAQGSVREQADWLSVEPVMKKIGFLNFGHWTDSPHSHVRSASDMLLQSIDLAVAAEELGADGAYFRVHHFARQLASPFPLLAAVGARTSRIEIGTGVIDMRYENPLYMAEDAGAADLIAGGRLQLGISRGSPEQVIEGWRYFGFQPGRGGGPGRHGPPRTPRCSSRC